MEPDVTKELIKKIFSNRSDEYPILTANDIVERLEKYKISYTPTTVRTKLKEFIYSDENPDGILCMAKSNSRDKMYYIKNESMQIKTEGKAPQELFTALLYFSIFAIASLVIYALTGSEDLKAAFLTLVFITAGVFFSIKLISSSRFDKSQVFGASAILVPISCAFMYFFFKHIPPLYKLWVAFVLTVIIFAGLGVIWSHLHPSSL